MKALEGKILVTLLACLFVFGLTTVSNVAYAVNVTVEYLTADYKWFEDTTGLYDSSKWLDTDHDYRLGVRVGDYGKRTELKDEAMYGDKPHTKSYNINPALGSTCYIDLSHDDDTYTAEIVGWRVEGISPENVDVRINKTEWWTLDGIYKHNNSKYTAFEQRGFDWFRSYEDGGRAYYQIAINIPSDQENEIKVQAWFLEDGNLKAHNHVPANSADGNGKYYSKNGVHGYVCYCGEFVAWTGTPQKAGTTFTERTEKGKDYSKDSNWKVVTCKDIADEDKKIITRYNGDKPGHKFECGICGNITEEEHKKTNYATGTCFCFGRKNEGTNLSGAKYTCDIGKHSPMLDPIFDVDKVKTYTNTHAYTCNNCHLRISMNHTYKKDEKGNNVMFCWCQCYTEGKHIFDGTGKCTRCTDIKECKEHDYNGEGICQICGFTKPVDTPVVYTPVHCYGDEQKQQGCDCKGIGNPNYDEYVGWFADESGHWAECSCGAKMKASGSSTHGVTPHEYDPNGTGKCIQCGFEHKGCKGTGVNFTNNNKNNGWFANGTHHWVECEVCHRHMQAYYNNNKELGQTPGKVAHYDGGKDGKGKKDGKCDACLSPIGHECVGTVGDEKYACWKANNDGHWVECAGCGQPKKGSKYNKDAGDLAYETGILPHNYKDNNKVCTTCGYQHKCVGTDWGENNGWHIDGANGHYVLCSCGAKMQGLKGSAWAVSSDFAETPGVAKHVGMEDGICNYCFYESNKVTVTYDLDGGKNGPPTVGMKKGSSYTINSIIPVNAGYNFMGWKDATGKTYKAGDKIVVEKNLVLRAIWENQTAKLHYDANGGENAPADDYLVVGMSTSINKKSPTREGFIFIGWNTEKSGTGDSYKFGDRLVTTVAQDVTLYAQWESKDGLDNKETSNKDCQHVYGDEYGNDNTHHWAKCTLCGGWSDSEKHTVDDFSAGRCTVCGYLHTHKGGSEWKSNVITHWAICEICGEKVTGPSSSKFGTGYHEYDANGKCQQCGYVKK